MVCSSLAVGTRAEAIRGLIQGVRPYLACAVLSLIATALMRDYTGKPLADH